MSKNIFSPALIDSSGSWEMPPDTILAVIGDPAEAGYAAVEGMASVDADTGVNHFSVGVGPHRYVVKLREDSRYAEAIDAIIS